MQSLTIAGTVGKDAILRTTQSGDHVLSFSVACDNGKDRDGNKRPATWYDASIWGKRATSLEPHIRKGTKLTLQGRPGARTHNDKAYLEISVNELAFQGGKQEQSGGYDQSPDRLHNPNHPPSGGGGFGGDFGDEIPFMWNWK